MARLVRGLGVSVVSLGVLLSAAWIADADESSDSARSQRGIFKIAQKTKTPKKKTRGKKAAPKTAEDGEMPAEGATTKTDAAPASDGPIKFSKDIAPILVGNCTGCHNDRQRRGKFDLTSFEKLMKGADKEKVIEPGKPEESHLVLRIKGEETPRMPQNNQRTLSDASIAKIERWVKDGAVLDAGIDPKAPIESYASTPEDLRKAELAKMTPDQRDKIVETAGLERWKKANPKTTPEVTKGQYFLLFSNLPKERASTTLKAVESQYTAVKNLLGPSSVDWGEKGSLFVFNDSASFGEFVRAQENRDIEPGAHDVATSKFTTSQPYVAVIDPLGGRDEPAGSAAPKKAARSKRGKSDDDSGSTTRTLPGLLIENFVIGASAKAGKPPRWVSLGLGALVASKVERGSSYYTRLRHDAYQICDQGWQSKANEALGDTTKVEEVRAVGFAIFEWLASVDKTLPPAFVNGMLGGGDKLDDVISKVLNGSREEFLNGSGAFVMSKYGR